jgi:hypothetical protein
LASPVHIDVAAVTLYRNPRLDKNGHLIPQIEYLLLQKLETVMQIGIQERHQYIVLTNIGCSVLGYPSHHIALLLRKVRK